MKEPTAALQASSLGDAIGMGWLLRDVDGVRLVGHAGSAIGQFAELVTVPERDFAVISLTNASPAGIPCNQAIVRWALRTYLGVTHRDPEPLPYDEAQAQAVVGSYENDAMTLTIATHRAGLMLEAALKPEVRAALDTDPGPDPAPCDLVLLAGDEYILTSGEFKGNRGFFTRDENGAVVGVALAGRLFNLVPTDAE